MCAFQRHAGGQETCLQEVLCGEWEKGKAESGYMSDSKKLCTAASGVTVPPRVAKS